MSISQCESEDNAWKIELRNLLITGMTGDEQAKRIAYEQIGYHYHCSAPASLYKYYGDAPRNLDNIKANKMWYSAPCNFNDVFDCEITVDEAAIINCALQMAPYKKKIRVGSLMWKQIGQNMRREIKSFCSTFEDMRCTTGISCFSESDDSLLMWAHYANNHRGICVEYDLMEINKQLQFTPIPIVYSNDRVCYNMLDVNTVEKDAISLFVQSLTSKSEEWSYEREWRIIRDDGACGDRWDAEKKGALLDMIRPSSIALGCAAEAAFEKSVRDYCEKERISLYKMQKDKCQYRLNKATILEFDT